MKNDITEVVFVLDRSGSMGRVVDDTIGGFNSILAKQQKEESEAYLTTCLFDDRNEWLHDHLNLKTVKPLTDEDYYVRGCTALYDAVGATITKVDNIVKHNQATKVIFVIITDGYENASREFTGMQVRKMIEAHQKKDWEFMFLGANIDAFASARDLGIKASRTANFMQDGEGIKCMSMAVSECIINKRTNRQYDESFLKTVNDDHSKRK